MALSQFFFVFLKFSYNLLTYYFLFSCKKITDTKVSVNKIYLQSEKPLKQVNYLQKEISYSVKEIRKEIGAYIT